MKSAGFCQCSGVPSKEARTDKSSIRLQCVSLNDVLLTGPNVNNSHLGVLLRFRRERVAVMADIQNIFHSFVVAKEHRNYLRFLWYDNNDLNNEVLEYQMRVHVFGNSPSPAVAIYGSGELLSLANKNMDLRLGTLWKGTFMWMMALPPSPRKRKASSYSRPLRKCWLNLLYIFTRLLPIKWKSWKHFLQRILQRS